MVHQRAKNQRRHRLADVKPRIHHAVNPAGRILGRGAFYQQIARWPRNARKKTHGTKQRQHGHARAVRKISKTNHQRNAGCQCKTGAHNAFAVRRIGRQKAAQHHAARAAHHVDRQVGGDQRHRDAVQLPRRLGRKGLHHAQRHGVEKEEGKTHPHGGYF